MTSVPRHGDDLPPGLYDALLTEEVRRGLPLTPDLYRLEEVDAPDAPLVLAAHLGRVLALVLRGRGLSDDPRAQIDLVNGLISTALADRVDLAELRAGDWDPSISTRAAHRGGPSCAEPPASSANASRTRLGSAGR